MPALQRIYRRIALLLLRLTPIRQGVPRICNTTARPESEICRAVQISAPKSVAVGAACQIDTSNRKLTLVSVGTWSTAGIGGRSGNTRNLPSPAGGGRSAMLQRSS